MVERTCGRQLKVLRSDNGGEYTSRQFAEYLKSEGVRHELSVPKTPQQNGVAERSNRTLMEMTRAMLSESKLPQSLWAESLSTATYLRNRSPTKAVKGKTPHEAYHGKKPDVGHLRVFGCTAYAHVAKDERKKLDMTARRCVLVGYGTEVKGYRLYDPSSRKVFYSRDVRFNESEIGYEKEVKPVEPVAETEPYVELDVSDDHVGADADGAPQDGESEPSHEEPRRSERIRSRPHYYAEGASIASRCSEEPLTFQQAVSSPMKAKWKEATEKEMRSLVENDVWELVQPPVNRKIVGSKWVFKVKHDGDGRVERYKARLVAQGYTQQRGADYDETFSPVVRMESLRTVIGLAARNGLKLHQLDVTTAFLNGRLQEEVYMHQPEGFVAQGQEHLVCKLNRSLYGLKQSPRCWNSTLDNYLKKIGFLQSVSDPCVYISALGKELAVVGVYVDDIVVACQSDEQLVRIKKDICQKFAVKDLGKLHHFLGIRVVQDDNTVWLGQPLYVEKVLTRFGMQDANPISTPVDPSTKLTKAAEGDEKFDQSVYQSAVGCLLYLSTGTRPDIAFAVGNVAKFSSDPTRKHWTAVKRILRYLKGTGEYGLLYSTSDQEDLHGFSDSDWAGDLEDRKSTSGYLFKLGGAPISWRSKKQTSVALSTAEAEYVALSSATQEVVWLRQLTTDLRNGPTGATVLYEDNKSAICMSKNAQFHGRAKHIDIRHHFIQEKVCDGTVELKYCPTCMIADILTKGLSSVLFEKLRDKAGNVPEPT